MRLFSIRRNGHIYSQQPIVYSSEVLYNRRHKICTLRICHPNAKRDALKFCCEKFPDAPRFLQRPRISPPAQQHDNFIHSTDGIRIGHCVVQIVCLVCMLIQAESVNENVLWFFVLSLSTALFCISTGLGVINRLQELQVPKYGFAQV